LCSHRGFADTVFLMVDASMHIDQIRLLTGGCPRMEARKVGLYSL
jgi:hypothetical protein